MKDPAIDYALKQTKQYGNETGRNSPVTGQHRFEID